MKLILYVFPLLLLISSGCSPDVPPPPIERNDLVVRFFHSLRNNSSAPAQLQGEKLYAMDKRNYFLLQLIAIQQANSYVRTAQGHLNSGNLTGAIKTLESGLRRFPGNTALHKQLDSLRKISRAERYFMAMRSAPNPTAMTSALTAAQAGLEGIESAKLKKYFANYKKSIDNWNKQTSPKSSASVKVPIRSFDDK